MSIASGLVWWKLGRYVQILIPLSSSVFAPCQRSVGCGAEHLSETPGVARHTPFDSLALRPAVAGDRCLAGQASTRPNLTRTNRPSRATVGSRATTARPCPRSKMAQRTLSPSGFGLVHVYGVVARATPAAGCLSLADRGLGLISGRPRGLGGNHRSQLLLVGERFAGMAAGTGRALAPDHPRSDGSVYGATLRQRSESSNSGHGRQSAAAFSAIRS
jgi:hypothetical protein